MKEVEVIRTLRDSIASGDVEEARRACKEVLTEGIPVSKAIHDGMAAGMNVVGQKFQTGELYLTDIIVAGIAMDEGLKILEPHLNKSEAMIGRVLLGTVEGDLHSIGRNVVKMFLKAAGVEVIDLGEDVPATRFVEAAHAHKPTVLGMSALITPTMPEMRKVIGELEKAGLRKGLQVIIGGAPVSREYAEKIGADAYAPDAVTGVDVIKGWILAGAIR